MMNALSVFGLILWLLFLTWLGYLGRTIERHREHTKVDYQRIAILEIDMYGQTFANADSPYAEGVTSLYDMPAIDSTGHYYDDYAKRNRCNVNIQLGDTCNNPDHYTDREWTDDNGIPW